MDTSVREYVLLLAVAILDPVVLAIVLARVAVATGIPLAPFATIPAAVSRSFYYEKQKHPPPRRFDKFGAGVNR
ncbi:MAG: hypothetical protein ACE5GO_01560 [Anaerolineales bacterium]